MATLQMTYYSLALSGMTSFSAVIPNEVPPFMMQGNKNYERPMKALYLLHGFSGGPMDWLYGSSINELATQYNIAVFMPDGANSFYLNQVGAGYAYDAFIGQEFVDYTRKTFGLSDKPEDTIIGGFSMGGFGAIHAGLAHPEKFGKMIGLSSALITGGLKDMTRESIGMPGIDYEYYERTFGNLKEVENTNNHPDHLLLERIGKGEKIQPIFMACGTEDMLVEPNRKFRDLLQANGVELEYHESAGMHNWKFWNEYLEPAIAWGVK